MGTSRRQSTTPAGSASPEITRKRGTSLGFTIVELMIVIVVIAILAAISVVAYTGTQERARRTAHQHAIAQAERAITAQAVLDNKDTSGITGSLIGYTDRSVELELLRPVSGKPDMTFYTACTDIAADGAAHSFWSPLTLRPTSAGNNLRFQAQTSGDARMGYRIDTSAQTNRVSYAPDVRVAGRDFIAWFTVAADGTQVAQGANSAAVHSVMPLTAHNGWEFTHLATDGQYCSRSAFLVFDSAHSESTRQSVIDWLDDQYGADL